MSKPSIAVLVGSLRRESHNKKLANAVTRLTPELEFSFLRMDDLPHYNGDLEESRPEPVKRFVAELKAADGVLIVTPEYNRSVPSVLKNAIDWASKPYGQNVWEEKVVALMGTSVGAIGTSAVQLHLRAVLGALSALVMGGEAYVTYKPELFDAEGNLALEVNRTYLGKYMGRFASLVERMRQPARV